MRFPAVREAARRANSSAIAVGVTGVSLRKLWFALVVKGTMKQLCATGR